MFSAVLVMLGFLGYYLTGDRYAAKKTVVVPFTLVLGKGRITPNGFEIQQLSPQGIALLSVKTAFPAQDFSTLEWRIKGISPKTHLFFRWDTSVVSDHQGSLSISGSENGQFRLDTRPQWRQTVRQLILAIEGELLNPVLIERIALKPSPPQPLDLLGQLWSEWTTFEGWRGYSINFIIGSSRPGLFPPVLAAATWVGLSVLLYSGFILVKPQFWDPKTFILIFLAGWLALDLRWQVDLWRQLDITREQYAGKNWQEKRLSAQDAGLFRFARNIKQHIPEPYARIFVISENPTASNRYTQLRLYYHLLPHNTFINSRDLEAARLSRPYKTRPGDYILILNPNPGIGYLPEQGVLIWDYGDKTYKLPVEPILSDPWGNLFIISDG